MSNNQNQGASIEAERELFEQHFGPKDRFAWRNSDGTYKVYALQSAWEIWQAARRTPAATTGCGELPPLPEPHQSAGEDAGCWFPDFFDAQQMKAYARAAIEADRAQLAQQGQGPVATVVEGRQIRFLANGKDFPKAGTLLYAAPASAQPAELTNAEFLAKRLGRVAKLAGVPMPDGTYEQIAEVAGTILGQIAYALERGAQPDQRESAAVPDGWKIERAPAPAKYIEVSAPDGTSHRVAGRGRNSEILLYGLCEAILAASPAAQPVAKDEQSALQGWQNAIESLSQQGQDSANNGADEQKGQAEGANQGAEGEKA